MRLKDILKENSDEEVLQEISRLLKNEFRNDLPKLYRATDRGFPEKYTVRNIRKDRSPIGGTSGVQIMLDFLAEEKYSNVPQRSKSKFASTRKDTLSVFGDYIYLVFPEKDANIVSFEDDTKRMRNSYGDVIRAIHRGLKTDEETGKYRFDSARIIDLKGDFEYLEKFLTYMFKSEDPEDLKSFLAGNWEALKKDLKRVTEEFPELSWAYEKFVNPRYFKEMKGNVEDGDSEVIFDGERYLYVKRGFFEDHFERTNGKWRLKNEIKKYT